MPLLDGPRRGGGCYRHSQPRCRLGAQQRPGPPYPALYLELHALYGYLQWSEAVISVQRLEVWSLQPPPSGAVRRGISIVIPYTLCMVIHSGCPALGCANGAGS